MLRVSLVSFGKIHKSTRVVINRIMYSIFAEAQDECVLCQINGFDFTLPVGIKITPIGGDYVLYYTVSTEDIIACLSEVVKGITDEIELREAIKDRMEDPFVAYNITNEDLELVEQNGCAIWHKGDPIVFDSRLLNSNLCETILRLEALYDKAIDRLVNVYEEINEVYADNLENVHRQFNVLKNMVGITEDMK